MLRNTEHAYRTFKRGTDVPERKTVPLVGPLVEWNVFCRVIRAGKAWYIQKALVSGSYQSTKNSEIKCVNVPLSKTRKSLKLLQNVLLKKTYFDSLPISKIKYDDLQCLVNSKILPHCHSSFTADWNWYSYILSRSLCLFVCLTVRIFFDFNIVFFS